MPGSPKVICVIGAECTGKTVLVRQLADALGGSVVPEVLRGWCAARGRTPQQHEQAALLQAQVDQEVQALDTQVRHHFAKISVFRAGTVNEVNHLR